VTREHPPLPVVAMSVASCVGQLKEHDADRASSAGPGEGLARRWDLNSSTGTPAGVTNFPATELHRAVLVGINFASIA